LRRTPQRAPSVVLLLDDADGFADHLLGDPGHRTVTTDERLVIGTSSQLAALENPRPHTRAFLALEVAVVVQAPGNP